MKRALYFLLAMSAMSIGCGSSGRYGTPHDLAGTGNGDDGGNNNGSDGGSNQMGCEGELQGCYTVYAHSDSVLYLVDLMAKQLKTVGPFNAPMVNGKQDVITDFAVAPDNSLWAISETNLYTVDANDGHVTLSTPVAACGTYAVALTFAPDGNLYAADYKGAFCHIDISSKPPRVTQLGMIGNNWAISGDIVSVGDGTMYGTAYDLADPSNTGTQINNFLITVNPSSGGAIQRIGPTGYPKLFGVAYALGQVFGFTHDGTGHVVTIDPKTGTGTLYNTFNDPNTGKGISFAGAGVNAMVAPTIM